MKLIWKAMFGYDPCFIFLGENKINQKELQ